MNFLKLEKGKQIGKTFSFEKDGQIVWSSVAMQKWDNCYLLYIDEIFETNMAGEIYEKEFIQAFTTIEAATEHLETMTSLKFEDLKSLKGRRIFNPDFANDKS